MLDILVVCVVPIVPLCPLYGLVKIGKMRVGQDGQFASRRNGTVFVIDGKCSFGFIASVFGLIERARTEDAEAEKMMREPGTALSTGSMFGGSA